ATVIASLPRATFRPTRPTLRLRLRVRAPRTTTSRSRATGRLDPAPGDEEPAQLPCEFPHGWRAVDRLFARYTPRSPCSAGTLFATRGDAVDGTQIEQPADEHQHESSRPA